MMASLLEPLVYEWTGTEDERRSAAMALDIKRRGNQASYLKITRVHSSVDPKALAVVANHLSRVARQNEIVRIEFARLPDEAFCRQFIHYADGFVLPVFTRVMTDTTGLDDVLMQRLAAIRELRIKTAVNIPVSISVLKVSGFAEKVRMLVWNRTSVTLKLDEEGMTDEEKTRMAEYIVQNGLELLCDAFDNLGRESMEEVILRLSAGKGLSNRIFVKALDGVDITPAEMLGSISNYRKAILQSGLEKVSDIHLSHIGTTA